MNECVVVDCTLYINYRLTDGQWTLDISTDKPMVWHFDRQMTNKEEESMYDLLLVYHWLIDGHVLDDCT